MSDPVPSTTLLSFSDNQPADSTYTSLSYLRRCAGVWDALPESNRLNQFLKTTRLLDLLDLLDSYTITQNSGRQNAKDHLEDSQGDTCTKLKSVESPVLKTA